MLFFFYAFLLLQWEIFEKKNIRDTHSCLWKIRNFLTVLFILHFVMDFFLMFKNNGKKKVTKLLIISTRVDFSTLLLFFA